MHRFFIKKKLGGLGSGMAPGICVWLSPEESRHALRVLRLSRGDEVQVFDGSYLWRAEIFNEKDGLAELMLHEELPSTEGCCNITLWQGLPKADKMEWIVQKGTELGADAFWPVDMERSIAHAAPDERGDRKQERLKKIAMEAVKQSGRVCVPEVRKTMSFPQALQAAEQEGFDAIFVAWEEEHALRLSEAIVQKTAEQGKIHNMLIIIGPEGGISPQEYARLESIGAKAVTLGKRILRTETAGLCALSVAWCALGEM